MSIKPLSDEAKKRLSELAKKETKDVSWFPSFSFSNIIKTVGTMIGLVNPKDLTTKLIKDKTEELKEQKNKLLLKQMAKHVLGLNTNTLDPKKRFQQHTEDKEFKQLCENSKKQKFFKFINSVLAPRIGYETISKAFGWDEHPAKSKEEKEMRAKIYNSLPTTEQLEKFLEKAPKLKNLIELITNPLVKGFFFSLFSKKEK